MSIIFKVDDLELLKRKEPYSSLDSMSYVYICLRDVEFDTQDVCPRDLRLFILIIDTFRRSFRCAFQVFLWSNVIPIGF